MEERKGRGYKEKEGGVLGRRRWRGWIYFWGKLDSASGGKMKKKLEEGDNSRTRISRNDGEMGGNEERYRMERKLLLVLLVYGLGG